MANQKVTDLDPIVTLPDSGIIHVIDTTNNAQNAAGSSFKMTKANFLKENTAAILLNTAKLGVTPTQATAITNNTVKVGYTDELVATAPTVVANTAKVGITPTQANAITANTTKVGYTEALVNANTNVVANTAKVGITSVQSSAILANTAKVGITPAQATAITDNTANTSKVSINNDVASISNVRSLRYREETYSSNLDMVMQSSVGVYAWVNVFTVAFNVVNSLVTRFKNRVATDGGTFENQTALETFLGTITSTLTTVLAAMTPNAFKDGKLYSVIPNTAALDATVLRSTTATRTNSAGIIVSSPVNTARINYLTVGGEGFILDEPQRTNIIRGSDNILNSEWAIVVGGGTAVSKIISNGITGTTISATSSRHFYNQSINLIAGTVYSFKVFIEDITGTLARPLLFTTNSPRSITVNKADVVNGFYQTTFTAANTETTTIRCGVGVDVNDTGSFTVAGFQLEIGANSTSYIPTLNSAVTRNADIITVAPPIGTAKITTTFSNNSTQVLTTIPATFTLPEGLIKSVNFNNTL